MIAFPAGTRVWIAGGVTDMRCGMNSLALKIQQGLGRDPHSGEIFCVDFHPELSRVFHREVSHP